MQTSKYFLLAAICFALIGVTGGGLLCKVSFGIACPILVDATGVIIEAETTGIMHVVVGAAVFAGTAACQVREKSCKRSVSPTTEIMLPFSDEFRHFDKDADKRLSYEEFVFTIMKSVNLAKPEDLQELFKRADRDEDHYMDEDEFHNAPFLFPHADTSVPEKSASPAA